MYLGREKIRINLHKVVVPFCEKCNFQDIKIIEVCGNCGSHQIANGRWQDKRAEKIIYEEKEVSTYSCDYCGEKFNELQNAKGINVEGEWGFSAGKSEYGKFIELCPNCLNKITDVLNYEASVCYSAEHIRETLEKVLGKGE